MNSSSIYSRTSKKEMRNLGKIEAAPTKGVSVREAIKPDNKTLTTSSSEFKINYTERNKYSAQERGLVIPRPSINGYKQPVLDKTDLYHNFPKEFDDIIVKNGIWYDRLDDMRKHGNPGHMFELPGTINGKSGIYQIGINRYGEVFHKHFRPIK